MLCTLNQQNGKTMKVGHFAEEIKDLVIRKIIILVNNDDPSGTR